MTFLEGIIYTMWRGFAIGIIISAPMGPVGILCVQRTLEKGRRTGFFTGVGAAISDIFYCLLTGFGLSFIEEFLKANQNVIQVIGSIVLILFGVYLFKSHPARKLKKPDAERTSKGKNVLSGFLFTFSNPLIIFLIIGLFARFNFLLPELTLPHYLIGFAFIFVGAIFWWYIVSFFVDKVRAHFNLRSMWLVNRIIGAIIMIFAVVGIVTAFTGSASAKTRSALYLNSFNGFGTMTSDSVTGSPLVIEALTCDTVCRMLPVATGDNFRFSFRASNLHNESGKRYAFVDKNGKKKKVTNPGWGVILKDGAETATILIYTTDTHLDELNAPTVNVEYRLPTSSQTVVVKDNSLDMYTGANSFKLLCEDGKLMLSAGNRRYSPVFSEYLNGFVPDSIGIFAAPSAKVIVDHLTLREAASESVSANPFSHFGNPDVRKSYFSRSSDEMEGEWEVFDRMLEDSELRSGGNYRLALIARNGGYDMIYLDGAVKNYDKWNAGMYKGRLDTTSFGNVFDVEWLDPSGAKIDGEIKAQLSSPEILTFQFPDHGGSTLRLRKVK